MKGINPQWGLYLGIIVTIQMAIGQGAVPLTNVFPADWIPYVVGWSQFLGFIGTTVMTALFGYSAQSPGPFVKLPDIKVPDTVTKAVVMFAVLLGGLVLTAAPSHAQILHRAVAKAAVKIDPGKNLSDALARLAAKGTADLEAADALASAIDPDTNKMVDPVAHACYPAMIKFIGSLPKASDTEPAGVAEVFERARIARKLVQNGLPDYLKIGCAPLVQDEAIFVTKILALAGIAVGTGGLAIPAVPGLLSAVPILP